MATQVTETRAAGWCFNKKTLNITQCYLRDVSRFAYKSICLHWVCFAFMIWVDSPTFKSFRLHLQVEIFCEDRWTPLPAVTHFSWGVVFDKFWDITAFDWGGEWLLVRVIRRFVPWVPEVFSRAVDRNTLRCGSPYTDMTDIRNRARKTSGTQGRRCEKWGFHSLICSLFPVRHLWWKGSRKEITQQQLFVNTQSL